MTSDAPIAALPYADLPARWGVGVDQTDHSLRVTIPPPPSIKDLPPGLLWSIVGIGALVCTLVLLAANEWRRGTADLIGPALAAAMYGGILVLLFGLAWRKLSQAKIIELDSSKFTVERVSRSGKVLSRVSWPRHLIGGAKYNVSSGKMVVRIIGIDMLDIEISRNRQVTEYVARSVDVALQEIPAVGHSPQTGSHRPVTSASPPLRRGRARTALIATSTVLCLAGAAMLFTSIAPAGFYLMLASIAPLGIALGTQPRDSYLC